MVVMPWSRSMPQFCGRQAIMIETHLGRRVGALGLAPVFTACESLFAET